MTTEEVKIGIDIGGSHITAGLIRFSGDESFLLKTIKNPLDSYSNANFIMDVIADCISETKYPGIRIETIGIAFPGPFDYKKGISMIAGVGGKFEKTFGLNVCQSLANLTGLDEYRFTFSNDAHCFAEGANFKLKIRGKRKIFLTLGTGFGSAFMEDNDLLDLHPQLPSSGFFYDQKFLDATADDHFSTRWFLNEYKRITHLEIGSVKEMIDHDPIITKIVFEKFGSNLGTFLLPWIRKFQCTELVIGGNISRASDLFNEQLLTQLGTYKDQCRVIYCHESEEHILTGAALIAQKNQLNIGNKSNILDKRKTSQALLPFVITDKSHKKTYDIYPSFHSDEIVYQGFDSLAEIICHQQTVIIDGFVGVQWEIFRQKLNRELLVKNIKALWYDINTCLKSEEAINELISENLNGDDPVFGKRYNGILADFFEKQKIEILHKDGTAQMCIIYGTGAALSNWNGLLIYAELPKNELQYRMRAGSANNIGTCEFKSNSQVYKRFYFVDWPVLNKHKAELLDSIDIIVDEQRIDKITWMEGNSFRSALEQMLGQAFRVRPWFEAGVWGGNWMKNHFSQLNQEEINYAWSFELITLENGIVIEGNNNMLEVSFDFLLYYDNYKLLGKAAKRFGAEFPIRFDYLDTFNGGNLSIQCHPKTEYIREQFGENFTQDETYYILDCGQDAIVYLGFQEDIVDGEFKNALIDSQVNAVELPVEKYVQKHKAGKHDLFLIPNRTIHASGQNNLVLEISSTPYIFTFKMYDWLRLDLNGKPRPINIEHAFNNLDFGRKGSYVQENLISKQVVSEVWENGRKFKLHTHPEHFYAIDRYEFSGNIQIKTDYQCNIGMLVEGETIDVIINGRSTSFNYAETFVIPAGVEMYELKTNDKAYVLVVYVKNECC